LERIISATGIGSDHGSRFGPSSGTGSGVIQHGRISEPRYSPTLPGLRADRGSGIEPDAFADGWLNPRPDQVLCPPLQPASGWRVWEWQRKRAWTPPWCTIIAFAVLALSISGLFVGSDYRPALKCSRCRLEWLPVDRAIRRWLKGLLAVAAGNLIPSGPGRIRFYLFSFLVFGVTSHDSRGIPLASMSEGAAAGYMFRSRPAKRPG